MKNNNFSTLRNETLKRQKILKLQKKFEQGLILESDLSKEEVIELEKLYDEQILELDTNIQKKESILYKKISLNNEYYKQAIALKCKNNK